MAALILTVSQFLASVNQTLEYTFPEVNVIGEVANFKISQGKWVFFDLKEDNCTLNCFLPKFCLRVALDDGMKVVVRGTPKITNWGKFSLTVGAIQPVGEGNIKKNFELLRAKLTKEGLFDPAKKRPLPSDLTKIGVISSPAAAGLKDFLKILGQRWGGLTVQIAGTQVQGLAAPDQIIRALEYFNERSEAQIIALLRGGGSADDLACFNDEKLVRAIAASKLPTITGIGHEQDISLADLAADVRAATPTQAAMLLTPDKTVKATEIQQITLKLHDQVLSRIAMTRQNYHSPLISAGKQTRQALQTLTEKVKNQTEAASTELSRKITDLELQLAHTKKILQSLDPELTLRQGYAIISGKLTPESVVKITTLSTEASAIIKTISKRKNLKNKAGK